MSENFIVLPILVSTTSFGRKLRGKTENDGHTKPVQSSKVWRYGSTS